MSNQKKRSPTYKSVQLAGKVISENGELTVRLLAPQLRRHFLKTYCKVGDNMSITMVNKRPKRSQSQNNFYHLYLSLISLSSGNTMEELKSWVKEKKLSKGISEVYGETVRVVTSSADLNMSEFCEMMNWVEERTKIPIPDPGPFNLPLTFDEYGHLKMVQTEKYSGMKAEGIEIKKKKNVKKNTKLA